MASNKYIFANGKLIPAVMLAPGSDNGSCPPGQCLVKYGEGQNTQWVCAKCTSAAFISGSSLTPTLNSNFMTTNFTSDPRGGRPFAADGSSSAPSSVIVPLSANLPVTGPVNPPASPESLASQLMNPNMPTPSAPVNPGVSYSDISTSTTGTIDTTHLGKVVIAVVAVAVIIILIAKS